MEKLLQMGKEFRLEGGKLLEFVGKQQKLEKEEKPRQYALLTYGNMPVQPRF